MKKLNLLFPLIYVLIVSCTTDDGQTDKSQDVKRFYKKTEAFTNGELTTIQEVFYNSDLTIKSVEIEEKDIYKRIYDVRYSDEKIAKISEITAYPNPDVLDAVINYNSIFWEEGLIKLVSEDSNLTLEIFHSGNYVDSTKMYTTSLPDNVLKQTFNRNSQDQLISNTIGEDVFRYSNFDFNKKPEPFGSVMEFEHSTFFLIFGLSVSLDNATSASYDFSGGGSYSHYLEYDHQGYVTKVSYDEPNSSTDYSINTYVEY